MSNATSIVNGSVHQGDRHFSDVSGGRQCAFTSVSALLCAKSCDGLQWMSNGRPTQLIYNKMASLLCLVCHYIVFF